MKKNKACELLETERKNIDRIDGEIIMLLEKRSRVVRNIGLIKKEAGISVYQPGRIEEVIRSRRAAAVRCGISPDMVEDLFRKVISESSDLEKSSGAD